MPRRRERGRSPQPARPSTAAPRGRAKLRRAAEAAPPPPPSTLERPPPGAPPLPDPAPDAVRTPAGDEPRPGGMEGEGGDGGAAARPPGMPRGDTF